MKQIKQSSPAKVPKTFVAVLTAAVLSIASMGSASAATATQAEASVVSTSAVSTTPVVESETSAFVANTVSMVTVDQAKESSCAAVTLRQGDRGSCVKELQKLLIKKGEALGSYGADGVFGKKTTKAVRSYQDDRSLTVDGIAGPQTWGDLRRGNSTIKTPSSKCYSKTIRQGSRGTCAKLAQRLLLENGEWLGTYGADGVFGSVSDQATEHYQDRYSLAVDGIIGPNTWKKLSSGKVKTKHLNSKCFSGGTWACVDISDQITYVFENGKLIRQMPSRTGGSHKFRGEWLQHKTPTGTFRILNRIIDEKSGLYDDSPMPHSQYFTNIGHAFHGSPSFTANGNYVNAKGKQQGSGGCVNLMKSDAKWLWNNVDYGDRALVQK